MFTDLWFIAFGALIILGLAADVPVLTMVGALAVSTGAIGWAWGRLSLERVTYERTLSQERAFIGDEVALTVTVTNRKPLPLPRLVVQDQFPRGLEVVKGEVEAGDQEGMFRLTSRAAVAWYERVRWHYTFRCKQRGYYRLGPAMLRGSDLFGLFHREESVPATHTLVVYPRMYPLAALGLLYRRPQGTIKGGNPLFEDVTRPAGVRAYQRGDPLKRVAWKATARSGTLQVRLLEPSVAQTLIVALNLDTVDEAWMGFLSQVLERSVIVAASVAQDGLERKEQVGLVSNVAQTRGRRGPFVEPSRRPSQLQDILETLAGVGPMTAGSLEQALLAEARRFPLGATVVVVTGLLRPGLAAALLSLRGRGHSVVGLWTGDGPVSQFPQGVEVHRVTVADEGGPHGRIHVAD